MTHEIFLMESSRDEAYAIYDTMQDTITYYLPDLHEYNQILWIVKHEWYHALFNWANEKETTEEQDQFIMKKVELC